MDNKREYLVFSKPEIGQEEIDAVTKVLKSGWLSTGPKVKEFEEKFKEYIGCKNAIAVNSCTAGLHLSLICHGIGKGDKVVVPSMTFAATVNVVEHVGATPIFVDIEEDSYNVNTDKIEQTIIPKTKAIMPVHFGGTPCDMNEIIRIADEEQIPIIEDAAHAIGAEYGGSKIGSDGTACFSFYPTKNITCGEGGMIATCNGSIVDKLRAYSLHGLSSHAWQRVGKEKIKSYEVMYPGYKYNMQDINAAMGLKQLEKVDGFNEIRKNFAKMYIEELEDFDLVELRLPFVDRKSSWHLFPILLKIEKLNITRDEFRQEMHKAKIGTGIHYNAMHLQPYYTKYFCKNLPQTEYVSKRTVSIPLQTTMNEDDLLYVVETVKKILNSHRRK